MKKVLVSFFVLSVVIFSGCEERLRNFYPDYKNSDAALPDSSRAMEAPPVVQAPEESEVPLTIHFTCRIKTADRCSAQTSLLVHEYKSAGFEKINIVVDFPLLTKEQWEIPEDDDASNDPQ